jgi:Lon protease-like protein
MMELDASVLDPALEAIPVFPLPGVVLFPRALLPLHIFEPRYRAMLADAMGSHKCMAMALAVGQGSGGGAHPPIARVAGAGFVVRHEAMPDGRSNLLLHGRARVLLDELPFEPPYRRARARILTETGTEVDEAHRAALLAAAAAFVAEARRHEVEIDFALPEGADGSAVADLTAHHLLLEAETRQRALEELDVGARVLFVAGALAAQTARLSRDRGAGAN